MAGKGRGGGLTGGQGKRLVAEGNRNRLRDTASSALSQRQVLIGVEACECPRGAATDDVIGLPAAAGRTDTYFYAIAGHRYPLDGRQRLSEQSGSLFEEVEAGERPRPPAELVLRRTYGDVLVVFRLYPRAARRLGH